MIRILTLRSCWPNWVCTRGSWIGFHSSKVSFVIRDVYGWQAVQLCNSRWYEPCMILPLGDIPEYQQHIANWSHCSIGPVWRQLSVSMYSLVLFVNRPFRLGTPSLWTSLRACPDLCSPIVFSLWSTSFPNMAISYLFFILLLRAKLPKFFWTMSTNSMDSLLTLCPIETVSLLAASGNTCSSSLTLSCACHRRIIHNLMARQSAWINVWKHFFSCTCPTRWSQWLSVAEYWYNTSFHSALGRTPFEVLYGYAPRHFGISSEVVVPVPELADWLQERELMSRIIQLHLSRAQQRMIYST